MLCVCMERILSIITNHLHNYFLSSCVFVWSGSCQLLQTTSTIISLKLCVCMEWILSIITNHLHNYFISSCVFVWSGSCQLLQTTSTIISLKLCVCMEWILSIVTNHLHNCFPQVVCLYVVDLVNYYKPPHNYFLSSCVFVWSGSCQLLQTTSTIISLKLCICKEWILSIITNHLRNYFPQVVCLYGVDLVNYYKPPPQLFPSSCVFVWSGSRQLLQTTSTIILMQVSFDIQMMQLMSMQGYIFLFFLCLLSFVKPFPQC